jgi:hypothetical protein
MDVGSLKDDWAWSPPVSLLGNTCLPLMEDDAADVLYNMLKEPLSQEAIVDLAPQFADMAETFMNDLTIGKFKSPREKRRGVRETNGGFVDGTKSDGSSRSFSSSSSGDDFREEDNMEEGRGGSDDSEFACSSHKIMYDALRSYTFDLIDGPILKMNRWSQANGESPEAELSILGDDLSKNEDISKTSKVTRKKMKAWMDRLKRAMCVIKMTFGPEWMYVWLLNEYGRAVNGRMHIQEVISEHVHTCSKTVPIQRKAGYTVKDAFAQPFPMLAMAENIYYHYETATGKPVPKRPFARERTLSEPNLDTKFGTLMLDGIFADDIEPGYPIPIDSSGIHVEPPSRRPLSYSCKVDGDLKVCPGLPQRSRSISCPDDMLSPPESPELATTGETFPQELEDIIEEGTPSILDSLLRRVDGRGDALTSAAVSELSILIWMMMDAGNAWTAMALNLLALEESACIRVQQELDELISLHGRENMFTPMVMAEMKVLDALLYEAIRLCPPFLGGMKTTTKTIELEELGLQIPKNCHIIFSQPTGEGFNLSRAIGTKPENLGKQYPSPELYGFLPLKGLEVPLMVLQSKVFIAVLCQRFTPFLSRKRTFIRKLKTALKKSKLAEERMAKPVHEQEEVSSLYAESASSHEDARYFNDAELSESKKCGATTQAAALKLFDKIPFPEPRRVLNVRERHSALEILGVSKLGYCL